MIYDYYFYHYYYENISKPFAGLPAFHNIAYINSHSIKNLGNPYYGHYQVLDNYDHTRKRGQNEHMAFFHHS